MASGTGLLGLDGRWDDELLATLGLEEEQLPELADELVLGDGAAANLGSGALGRTHGRADDRHLGGTAHRPRAEHAPSRVSSSTALDEERVIEGGAISDGGNLLDWLERLLGTWRPTVSPPIPPASSTSSRCLEENAAPAGARTPAARSPGSRSARSRGTSSVPRSRASRTASPRSPPSCPSWRRSSARAVRCSSSPDWAQILADVLELPVTLSGADEASARGAAVAALARLGIEPPPAPARTDVRAPPGAVRGAPRGAASASARSTRR